MGYNGKVDKSHRGRNNTAETNRVIQTGLEMVEIVKEFREQTNN